MRCLLFLILFNSVFSYAADNKPKPKAKTQEELRLQYDLEVKKLKKLQADLTKRYKGKEGIKQLQKDYEKEYLKFVEQFKDYNEGKESFNSLFKIADSFVQYDENGEPIRLKNMNDFKKESDKNYKIFLKEISKKKGASKEAPDSDNEIEKRPESNKPVPFDIKMAEQEEKDKVAKKRKEKIVSFSKKLIGRSEDKSPLYLLLASLFVIIPLGWFGWKKWR